MPAEKDGSLHLYQDLVPVNSLVVSHLDPVSFYQSVTINPAKFIRFPGLVFVELGLGELADDPENGSANDLPYSYIHHLREALMVLKAGKDSKMVHRVHSMEFPYRMVKKGIYVGNGGDLVFYSMLSHHELRDKHTQWWRSANI